MTPGVDRTSRVVRVAGLLSATVGQEVVMLNMTTNAYYDADAIGAVIWRQIEAPCLVSDLVQWLVQRYDVGPDVCEVDVIRFLSDALAEGLIQVIAADPAP